MQYKYDDPLFSHPVKNVLLRIKFCYNFHVYLLLGHNLYNEDITKFLMEHGNSKERSAYILMERIFPWQQRNYLVKNGVPFVLSDVIGELGIYGVYIG